jgi:tetratricopeptide (TPR) repeat protein
MVVAAAVAALLLLAALSPGAGAQDGACAKPNALEQQTKLDSARDAYDEVLGADPGAECAVAGIRRITQDKARETAACERGKALDESTKPDEADQAYVEAVKINVESECGKAGLTAPPEAKSARDRSAEWLDYLGKVPGAIGAVILIVAIPVALVAMAIIWWRRRKPSLVVRKFVDGAMDDKAKVGAAVGSLVEQRLLAVREANATAGESIYELDLVRLDVELLAEEEDLDSAVGSVSEIPQLGPFLALLAMFEKTAARKRYAVGGELMPEGSDGYGLSLALYRKNSVEARHALWSKQVKDWAPGHKQIAGGVDTAKPYYPLAEPAAAWVQYQAGRALDANLGRITTSAESFALASTGLRLQRAGDYGSALVAYAQALFYDADNVAALFNASYVLGRLTGRRDWALLLLERAAVVLRDRHRSTA